LAILFAAAFFPRFIHADASQLPQFAILLTTFTVIAVGWYFVYAGSGKRLSVYLQRASVMKAFNRITGGVFVGFAALMATAESWSKLAVGRMERAQPAIYLIAIAG